MADGKKSRKFGRTGRALARKAYNAGARWSINKRKNIERHKKRMAYKAAKRLRWQARTKLSVNRRIRRQQRETKDAAAV